MDRPRLPDRDQSRRPAQVPVIETLSVWLFWLVVALVVWLLISIPVALVVGRVLRVRRILDSRPVPSDEL